MISLPGVARLAVCALRKGASERLTGWSRHVAATFLAPEPGASGAVLGGCGSGAQERTAAAAADLSPSASVYVAVPADGRFAGHVYPDSGRRLALLIARAYAPHISVVTTAAEAESEAASLASARGAGFTYLAVPRILRWEDRAGVWSGMADAAEVRIALIDTRSGDAADIAVIAGHDARDRVTAGEGAPEDLLARPLEAYAARVFAPAPAAADSAQPPR
ncbi:MAG: DUF4823 domain-containing protein [Rhodospirillales bacterium]|nr:DUF4823 domain-containing protein [Rhodospirillales bacterium]